MTFKQYRDKLSANRFNPLSNEELNALAISKEQTDVIANTCQRLIIKAMATLMHFDSTPDDLLFEYVAVGNEAIAYSIHNYSNDERDFAVYVYVNILNHIKTYHKRYTQLVRRAKVEGIYHTATYEEISSYSEENEQKEIRDELAEFEFDIDWNLIYSILREGKHPIKEQLWNMFVYHLGLEDENPKTLLETADKFGCTSENIRLAVHRIRARIQKSEKIMNYLSQFSEY